MFPESEKPILSAIIPVGNLRTDYENLQQWISTVDFTQIEIILVIDRLQKSDEQLLEKLQKKNANSKFIVCFGSDSGPGSARNIGLELASAPWICFWDSDDLPYYQNVLRNLVNTDCNNYDAIVGTYETQNHEGRGTNTNLFKANMDFENLLLIALNPGIWRMCFNAKSIKNLRFPNIYMGEDQVFIADFFLTKRKINFINTVFYKYNTGWGGQLTKNRRKKKDLLIAITKITKLIRSSENREFIKIQTIRLVITGLLRGDLKTRMSILKILILSTKIFSVISPMDFLKTYGYIRRNRNGA